MGPRGHTLSLSLVLAGGLLAAACREKSGRSPDAAAPPPVSAEERFGNDRELVADFNNLGKCAYADGRLDTACPEVAELRLRMATRTRKAASLEKLVTTLANLLESARAPTRLMATASLSPHLTRPRIRKALEAAWAGEEVPAIRALMLRQLCRAPGGAGAKLGAGVLSGETEHPAAVQAEAATCLGRAAPPAAEEIRLLRKVLGGKAPATVKGNACEALGRLRGAAAIKDLAAQLGTAALAHRCATALAAIGGDEAYAALRDATQSMLSRGTPLSAQAVRALASFEEGREAEVGELLRAIAAEKGAGEAAREMAREMARERIGGTK